MDTVVIAAKVVCLVCGGVAHVTKYVRYADDWGARKCGELMVCQDSLADALGDVQDRREAAECNDFGAGREDTTKTYGRVRC